MSRECRHTTSRDIQATFSRRSIRRATIQSTPGMLTVYLPCSSMSILFKTAVLIRSGSGDSRILSGERLIHLNGCRRILRGGYNTPVQFDIIATITDQHGASKEEDGANVDIYGCNAVDTQTMPDIKGPSRCGHSEITEKHG
ncbi:hypothetical protein DPMN_101379 [Dreissena polymorpha]|uniref:Uncharacterized protein n=1 Tax=Dreissena polymorpha TaxID=45954 RepID=A0A9D4RA10_DREPO|nr:hypothetical protein DPMN_101379 [Dreissena polymorpha]